MNGFVLYPALDIREGRVVRLQQGDYARETRYPDDPVALAKAYAEAGAEWLHLVDLDAARLGRYTLDALLGALKSATGLKLQTGGGVRSEADVAALLAAGADRVVIGSLAVREPRKVADWLQRYGSERITLALDTRRDATGRWRLPVSGWTRDGSEELHVLAAFHAEHGLRHLLCTDIGRDGMLGGPNLDLYRELCARQPGLAVQASGGVAGLGDLVAVREAGCAGVVIGKALLEGRLDLSEACAAEASC